MYENSRSEIPVYSNKERDRRWELGRRLMDAEGLEALIIYGDREGSFPAPFAPDTYFTNDRPGTIVVFPRKGEPISIVAFPMAVTDDMQARARNEAVWIRPENMFAGKKGEAVVQVLKKLGLDRSAIGVIGLEPYPPFYFDGAMPYNTCRFQERSRLRGPKQPSFSLMLETGFSKTQNHLINFQQRMVLAY